MKVRAQEIFSCHLATGATEPVNIDSVARKRAAECLENPVPDMFDMSQQQIFRLMKTDSYVRFLKSDMYKECVVAEMEGRHLPYQPEDSDEDKRK
ncbi:regulator of G-protein signaling 12-like, partial [Lingula anatina]